MSAWVPEAIVPCTPSSGTEVGLIVGEDGVNVEVDIEPGVEAAPHPTNAKTTRAAIHSRMAQFYQTAQSEHLTIDRIESKSKRAVTQAPGPRQESRSH